MAVNNSWPLAISKMAHQDCMDGQSWFWPSKFFPPPISSSSPPAYAHITGQGRIDGAICEFTEDKRLAYLKRLQEAGVVNIEMECTALASICHKAGVKCSVICVTLLDRLQGDQVEIPSEVYRGYQARLQGLVAKFIRSRLGNMSSEHDSWVLYI